MNNSRFRSLFFDPVFFGSRIKYTCLFLIFMFLVEAYPAKQNRHHLAAVWAALAAGGISVGLFVAVVYPTGVLMETLSQFTTVSRQLILLVFCGLLGWTLGKWQKF